MCACSPSQKNNGRGLKLEIHTHYLAALLICWWAFSLVGSVFSVLRSTGYEYHLQYLDTYHNRQSGSFWSTLFIRLSTRI